MIEEVEKAKQLPLSEAVPILQKIVSAPIKSDDDKSTRIKEQAIYGLGELYVKNLNIDDLKKLLIEIRPFFDSIAQARTAKIVKTLIDKVGSIPNSTSLQIELCKESIVWCERVKRTFLRQRIQSRLAALLLEQSQYKSAFELIGKLGNEVRKLDDKLLMVEILLTESRIHLALSNISKAKASLTTARASANSVYCPPRLQAHIDQQAGTLCAQEKDFKTAYSYFYESFEGFGQLNDRKEAIKCFMHMILCKIMTNNLNDAFSLINGKQGIKYAGPSVESMRSLTKAYKERKLSDFLKVKKDFPLLKEDEMIQYHMEGLYENLLEQNLLRIIEPYSRVQISYIAKTIDLPVAQIEAKLSGMILDNKLSGILDQGVGDLIIYEPISENKMFQSAIDSIKELGFVVDRLHLPLKNIASRSQSQSKSQTSSSLSC